MAFAWAGQHLVGLNLRRFNLAGRIISASPRVVPGHHQSTLGNFFLCSRVVSSPQNAIDQEGIASMCPFRAWAFRAGQTYLHLDRKERPRLTQAVAPDRPARRSGPKAFLDSEYSPEGTAQCCRDTISLFPAACRPACANNALWISRGATMRVNSGQ